MLQRSVCHEPEHGAPGQGQKESRALRCLTQACFGLPGAVEEEARKSPGARGNSGHFPRSPLLAGLGEVKAVPPGQPPLFPVWFVSLQGARREKPSLAFLSEGFRQAGFISVILPFITWGNPKYVVAAGTVCKMGANKGRSESWQARMARVMGTVLPGLSLCSLPSLI